MSFNKSWLTELRLVKKMMREGTLRHWWRNAVILVVVLFGCGVVCYVGNTINSIVNHSA